MTLPTRSYAAFLFDMDGTILTSIASAERTWTAWAIAHGLDVATFLPTIHGVQSVETVRRLGLPGVDPVVEAAAITAAEMEDVADIAAIRGAAKFLATLPPERWTIVTSAPRALAERRLAAAGLAIPTQFIAAEDVTNGKPAPDCFLLAAERLGVSASDCLVFEGRPLVSQQRTPRVPMSSSLRQRMPATTVLMAGGTRSAITTVSRLPPTARITGGWCN